MLFMCAMFGVPALATAFYLLHCRIVADARGLTFHGWHRRQFVSWSAVEDYELRFPTSNQSSANGQRAFIQSGGKWRRVSELYRPRQLLLDRIAREAKWARAQSWQLGETRDDGDWPKTFRYRDGSGWKLVGSYLLFALTLGGLQFFKAATYGLAPLLSNLALTWSGLSPWGRVGFVALPFLLFGSMPLLILAQYPAIVARRAYLNRSVVASREGLRFERGGGADFLPWDEITAYYLEAVPGHFQPTRFVVETRRQKLDFLGGISGGKALQTLIQQRAQGASTREWLHFEGASEEVLGGAASFYRSGSVGVGPKIYHYRTRTARIFLLFGLVMMVAIPFVIYQNLTTGRLGNGQIAGPADTAMGVFLFALVTLIFVWGSLSWLFSSVVCENEGLRQRGIWGERFLRWDEIQSFTTNGYNDTAKGARRAIRYSVFIADAAGLRAEIEKRSGIVFKKVA